MTDAERIREAIADIDHAMQEPEHYSEQEKAEAAALRDELRARLMVKEEAKS